jgi:hypothetical protein
VSVSELQKNDLKTRPEVYSSQMSKCFYSISGSSDTKFRHVFSDHIKMKYKDIRLTKLWLHFWDLKRKMKMKMKYIYTMKMKVSLDHTYTYIHIKTLLILYCSEGFCRWKLSSGNLYTFIRPNPEQKRKMQL